MYAIAAAFHSITLVSQLASLDEAFVRIGKHAFALLALPASIGECYLLRPICVQLQGPGYLLRAPHHAFTVMLV